MSNGETCVERCVVLSPGLQLVIAGLLATRRPHGAPHHHQVLPRSGRVASGDFGLPKHTTPVTAFRWAHPEVLLKSLAIDGWLRLP